MSHSITYKINLS